MKSFCHNGKLGDIIYSLPTIISRGGGVLYISNEASTLGINEKVTSPDNIMTTEMVIQIVDFLKTQPYLEDVRIYKGESIDFNLNKFREYVLGNPFRWNEHLAQWHLKIFGTNFNLALPWIYNIEPVYLSDIVVNHSGRYINFLNNFNWNILQRYADRCIFIGHETEYEKFKDYTGLNIKRYATSTLLEFAQIIKGSKLFIGNQSLGFALAEAMKCPRVLEIWYFKANCMPQSSNGHIWLRKKIIEKYLKT